MDQKEEVNSSRFGSPDSLEEKAVKGMLEPSKLEELFGEASPARSKQYALFRQKLESAVQPYLTAKELTTRVVRAALEIEYGQDFAKASPFDKMVDAIANTIVTNPELRRQLLAMVSPIIERKIEKPKKPD